MQTSDQKQTICLKDILIAVFIFTFWIALYVRTLSPGLLPGDSGEFQVLAYKLGHAHTTGYSSYLIFANMFTWLPIASVAYRVNLFSAFMAAATLVNIYLIGKILSKSIWSGLIGTTTLGISAVFWSQAVIAEVYTAASAFSSGILLMLLLWTRTDNRLFLLSAGILGGISVGIHASISLMAPAVLIFLSLSNRDRATWLVATTGAVIGICFTLAAFVFIDQAAGNHDIFSTAYRPAIAFWDLDTEDIESAYGRFSFLITAKQWRPAMFTNPISEFPQKAWEFAKDLTSDFSISSLILLCIGWITLFFYDWQAAILFTVGCAAHFFYTLNYSIGDIYVFYINGFLYFAVFITIGANLISNWIKKRFPSNFAPSSEIFIAFIFFVAVIFPFYNSRVTFLREKRAVFAFASSPDLAELNQWHTDLRAAVRDLDPYAIVFTNWHDLYPYIYTAVVDENRPDLHFIETKPYSTKSGIAMTTISFILKNIKLRPVFTTDQHPNIAPPGYQYFLVFKGPVRMYLIRENP